MKIQKTTWILLIVAILLGGGVYLYETVAKPKQEEVKTQQKQIFTFTKEDIKGLTVETKGQTLKFERTQDQNKPWRMKQPEDITASDAAVSFLLEQLVTGKRDRSLKIPVEKLQEFGLKPALATITVQLNNQENHTLILGNSDLQDQYIYAQVDPKPEDKEIEVILVPKELKYGVERELTEWKQPEEKPPEQPTVTPSSPSN